MGFEFNPADEIEPTKEEYELAMNQYRPKVYVAGPISKGDQFRNCYNAFEVGDNLIRLGFHPFVPHMNCFWHLCFPQTHTKWLEWDFAWIDVCDALLRIPGESIGADKEIVYAKSKGIPVYYYEQDLVFDLPALISRHYNNNKGI